MKVQSVRKVENRRTIVRRITKVGLLRSLGLYVAILIPAVFLLNILRNSQDLATTSSPSGKNPVATVKPVDTAEGAQNVPHKWTDFVYPTDVERDPFERQVEIKTAESISSHAEPLPILTGVIWKSEDSIAILKDESQHDFLVRVDWWVNSYKVVAIFPRSVFLEKDGHQYKLELWEAEEEQFRYRRD